MIIEKEDAQEKLRLLAMRSLKELAVGGYHTLLLDMTMLSRLLKFLQPTSIGSAASLESEEAPSCLYWAAFQVLDAIISASSYNS